MTQSTTGSIDESPASESRQHSGYAVPVILGLLWAQLFWALHPTWSHGQYYDYGWVVAPVATWFFWRRWRCEIVDFRGPIAIGRRVYLVAVPAVILLLFLLSLARILERFDPIWRIPLIFHAAVVFATTHLVLWACCGFRRSLAYLPVLLFALTAVPWPAKAENMIIGELTDQLLACSAPLSRLLGSPVELSGSALVADGKVVNIDEGCSGIRSFQSLLMAGLFVGEFMMLRWRWRLTVLFLALATGFVTNLLRASLLTWIFVNEGELTFDRYHDLVGFLAFGCAASLLLLFGSLFDKYLTGSTDEIASPGSGAD